MASGPLVGGGDDGSRDKHRWLESKVYTRKSFNKSRNVTTISQPSSQTLTATEDGSSSQQQQQQQQAPPPQHLLSRFDAAAASDDSSSLNRRPVSAAAAASREPPSGNGLYSRVDNRVKINLSSRSKQELRELRRKLSHELDQVRSLVKRLDARELQLTSYSRSQPSANEAVDNGIGTAKRGNLEVASMWETRPPPQLNVSVPENSRGGGMSDVVEKEKRTPKANQYYRNSDFLLGKERLPPADSNKKVKTNGSKKHGMGDGGYYGMGAMDGNLSRSFKECSSLLSKLMKHKHGWVFNTPVDVRGLGLHDYYTIIKNPMDLGTVKSRLNKNWYKSPREFAEDVRLTFRNAMTYNPKGQDVHIMADQLLKIFEERWAVVEAEFSLDDRFNVDSEFSPTTPRVMKKAPAELRRLDRSESTNLTADSKPKSVSYTPTGRVAAPKKPKAKDPNKRDMTYEEKQKLSTNLLSLPPEKLDNIVQIIKKRNPSLSQNDDEIEVDIESFDAETLWELDRFVVNYKKSLSKNKKKAELANQARVEAATNNVQDTNRAPVTVEVVKESKTDEKNDAPSSPVEREKPGDNASRSSSSSSSSSDSGSSSSDSDSDSSSASDVPRSPRA